MPATIAMALVGAGGIAFYIRFFVALSRERKVHKSTGGHWIRLRLESDEDPIFERRENNEKNLVLLEGPVLTRYAMQPPRKNDSHDLSK